MAKSKKSETVSKAMQEKFGRITAITDAFAHQHFNEESILEAHLVDDSRIGHRNLTDENQGDKSACRTLKACSDHSILIGTTDR
jgi:hypothetical protein